MLDAFISYSTHNKLFVQDLAEALDTDGKKAWFDQNRDPLEGIPSGSKWWDEIKYGISQSSNFLFIISPQSVVSPYCNAEIAHALQQDKRLVTVLYCAENSIADTLNAINRAIDAIDPSLEVPPEVEADLNALRSLARRNWLVITQLQFVTAYANMPIAELASQVGGAIDLDIQWIRLWNDFTQAVQLWLENNKDDGYLWSEIRLRKLRALAEERHQELNDLQQEFAFPEAERLLRELEIAETSHNRRAEIGIALNRLGDPRSGVGVIHEIPDITWCAVSGGQIEMKNNNFNVDIFYNKIFNLQPFYIAQYLITYQQFQAFLDDPNGFTNPQWWVEIPPDYVQQSMNEQVQQHANYPRENVSWYQAVAFTRWLNDCLQGQTFTPINKPDETFIIGNDLEIRLPTEWEWQYAATGGNPANKYPWGEWQDGYANTVEAKLGRPTAVGIYPIGQTHHGAFDMAGNVREWGLNDYGTLRIITDNGKDKVQKGGSFYYPSTSSKCVIRNAEKAHNISNYCGFRVACGPESNLGPGDFPEQAKQKNLLGRFMDLIK